MVRKTLVATLIAVGLSAATTPLARASEPHDYVGAVWVEPVGAVVVGISAESLLLGFGGNIVVGPSLDVVIEGAVTYNSNWWGCSTETNGGWIAVGVLWRPWDTEDYGGFFLQPKLRGRFFNTTGGEDQPAVFFFPGCEAEPLRGTDGEVGIGLDFGYQWTIGPVYIATVVGGNAGVCINCPGGEFFDWDIRLFSQRGERATGFTAGINLSLLRVGVAF